MPLGCVCCNIFRFCSEYSKESISTVKLWFKPNFLLYHVYSSRNSPTVKVFVFHVKQFIGIQLFSICVNDMQANEAQAQMRIQEAKNQAAKQAQQDCCTGNFKIFDSPFGNYFLPVIPSPAELSWINSLLLYNLLKLGFYVIAFLCARTPSRIKVRYKLLWLNPLYFLFFTV